MPASRLPLRLVWLCHRVAVVLWARLDEGHRGAQSGSAWSCSSCNDMNFRAPMCVGSRFTGQANRASRDSFHRGAHTHQESPGCKPGKPNSGFGVDRSLLAFLLNARNYAVALQQSVCKPTSEGPVLQRPVVFMVSCCAGSWGWCYAC